MGSMRGLVVVASSLVGALGYVTLSACTGDDPAIVASGGGPDAATDGADTNATSDTDGAAKLQGLLDTSFQNGILNFVADAGPIQAAEIRGLAALPDDSLVAGVHIHNEDNDTWGILFLSADGEYRRLVRSKTGQAQEFVRARDGRLYMVGAVKGVGSRLAGYSSEGTELFDKAVEGCSGMRLAIADQWIYVAGTCQVDAGRDAVFVAKYGLDGSGPTRVILPAVEDLTFVTSVATASDEVLVGGAGGAKDALLPLGYLFFADGGSRSVRPAFSAVGMEQTGAVAAMAPGFVATGSADGGTALLRVGLEGANDPTFAPLPLPLASEHVRAQVLAEHDGDLYVAGRPSSAPSESTFAVARFESSGRLDGNFGVRGVARYGGGVANAAAQSMTFQPARRRVVVAGTDLAGGSVAHLILAAFK
jgi:hypothetical protein